MNRQQVINDGLAIEALLHSEGWKVVTAILDGYAEEANTDLIGYMGTDTNVMKSKQLSARILSETNKALHGQLTQLVEEARRILMTGGEDNHE